MARKPNLIERLGMALAGPYVREAAGDVVEPDEMFYRRITDARRDLNPISYQRAQEISYHLWRSNPMAHRMIEMMVDFVVGADGVTIEAADDSVQEVIDEFWTDPRSHWDLRQRDLVRDLSIYGELALRKFVNDQSGKMRVGYLDTARIADVLPDPDDMLVDKTLLISDGKGGSAQPVDLVVYDDLTDPGNPKWVGDAFYFAINRVIGQHRGNPDLFAIADYVDGYDQLLFNALERTGLINAFVWDVTLDGADDPAIARWQQKYPAAPPPGSVRVHNEHEHWATAAPSLGSQDIIEIGRAVKNMGLGGAGLPEAWFAEGDSANRATLQAQGDPTYRMLQSRQRYVRSMFERIIGVLIQENLGGRLSMKADTEFKITLPELDVTDTSMVSNALPQVTTALVAAIGESLIDRKSARSVFLGVATQLGIELDPQDVEDAINEQKAEEQQRSADALAAARQAMIANAIPGRGADPNAGSNPDQNAPGEPPEPAAAAQPPTPAKATKRKPPVPPKR